MFDREAWLADLAGHRDEIRRYAAELVKHADQTGHVRASLGWLRKAIGGDAELTVSEVDLALSRLTKAGMFRQVSRGSHGNPSVYALTPDTTRRAAPVSRAGRYGQR